MYMYHQFEREEVDVPEWNKGIGQSKEDYPPRYVFKLTPTEETSSSVFELELVGMNRELKFLLQVPGVKKPLHQQLKGTHIAVLPSLLAMFPLRPALSAQSISSSDESYITIPSVPYSVHACQSVATTSLSCFRKI